MISREARGTAKIAYVEQDLRTFRSRKFRPRATDTPDEARLEHGV